MMNADVLYSALLIAAMGAAIAGAGLGVFGLISRTVAAGNPSRALPALLFTGLVAGAASMIVHAVFGHGARSAEPMTGGIFLAEHVAFAVVACLILVGSVTWAIGRRKP